jgi:hypothetical protein
MDVFEYEGQSKADGEFWDRHADVDPATRERVERLRPSRPFWISAQDPVAQARWAASWRLPALFLVVLELEPDEREARRFVWHTARAFYASDIPVG